MVTDGIHVGNYGNIEPVVWLYTTDLLGVVNLINNNILCAVQ